MSNVSARWRYALVSGFVVLVLLGIVVASYAYTDKVSTNDSNPDPGTSELATPNDDAMECDDPDGPIAGSSSVGHLDVNRNPRHRSGSGLNSGNGPNHSFAPSQSTGPSHSSGGDPSHRHSPSSQHPEGSNASNNCQASPNAADNERTLQSIKPKRLKSGEQAPRQPYICKPSVPYPFPEDYVVSLLIGPPDVGKSMLINSVINYITHRTNNYPDVLQNPARLVIPVLRESITDTYKGKPVIMFANNTECKSYNYIAEHMSYPSTDETGCHTRDVRHYAFPWDNTGKTLVFIDTPGIAEDFYGSKDIKKSNFKRIGKVLGERGINRIHYLWIVLPPDEINKRGQVAHALKLIKDELFTSASHLDFVKLICTRSRTTEYRFSDTLSLVTDAMQEVADRHKIALTGEFWQMNSCGVDNESILRWLFPQILKGLTPSELALQEAAYVQSWNASCANIHWILKDMLKKPAPYMLPPKWLEPDAE